MSAAEILQEGAVDIEGATRFSGIRRTRLYELMDGGELAFTKVGSRRLIPLVSLKAVLAKELVGVEAAVESPEVPSKKGRRLAGV